MNSNYLKFIAAILLFIVWIAFAWMGKTPVDGLITAIGAALSGLGIYHSVTPSKPSVEAPAPKPTVPPTPNTPPAPPAQ